MVSARTEYTQTFANPDGTHTLISSMNPLNYQDAKGAWQPIDSLVVPDPAVPGGFRSAANSWTAHFEPLPTGLVIDTANGTLLSFSPQGAAAVAPQVTAGGTGVIYKNAWPGVDLEYLVGAESVKEEIVLNRQPTSTNFAFGTGSTGFTAQGAGLVPQGSAAGQASLPGPLVTTPAGQPIPAAAPALATSGTGSSHQVSVGVSSSWLDSLSASSYPVIVDPSIALGSSNLEAISSTGTTCSPCELRVGNDLGGTGGANRYWRSVGYFDYAPIDGDYVTAATVSLGDLSAGAPYSYTITAAWASAYSFAGAISDPLATAPGGSSVTFSSTALTTAYRNNVLASDNGMALGFSGLEYSGQLSYQQFESFSISLTYYALPSASVGRTVTPCSSVCASPVITNSSTPTLTANAANPSG